MLFPDFDLLFTPSDLISCKHIHVVAAAETLLSKDDIACSLSVCQGSPVDWILRYIKMYLVYLHRIFLYDLIYDSLVGMVVYRFLFSVIFLVEELQSTQCQTFKALLIRLTNFHKTFLQTFMHVCYVITHPGNTIYIICEFHTHF